MHPPNGGLAGWSAPSAARRNVEDTGEVDWLVDDALRMEVPVPVIAQSVMRLMASRDRIRTAHGLLP
jgi:6-phosphogluconate dehydrogenase (decarboxylating)